MSSDLSSGPSKLSLHSSAPSNSKGRLFIKIVEAKQLLCHNDIKAPKPYCVVQFENNETIIKESNYLQEDLKPQQPAVSGENKRNPIWQEEVIFDVTKPDGELVITIYERQNNGEEDTFLGHIKIRPPRYENRVQDNWFRLVPRQWREKVAGDLHVQIVYKIVDLKPLTTSDFELLRVLGKGSFGKVVQVRKKDTGRIYAMKVINKKLIVERGEIDHTMAERSILQNTNFPYLVGLKFAFQSLDKLYLVLDFMNGGELFFHLQQSGKFNEERSRFYAAQVILALEHLHKHNIIYRDLKLENILMDSNGNVNVSDFGLSKENMSTGSETTTFCGTAQYLAPEVIKGEPYTVAVDWWALGVLLYEMLTGLTPFHAGNHMETYHLILKADISYPSDIKAEARSLISQLLVRNPKKRLQDPSIIRVHPFFASINWDKLFKKELKPPFKPNVKSDTDISNFDKCFTDMTVKESPTEVTDFSLLQAMKEEFKGFSYNEDHLNNMASPFNESSQKAI